MRLRLIIPDALDNEEMAGRVAALAAASIGPSTEIEAVALKGETPIGIEHGETLQAVGVVAAGSDAEQDGCDAVVIDSVADPGLYALRSRLSIPVVGSGLAAFSLALTLGPRFAVLAPTVDSGYGIEKALRLYGLTGKCTAVRELAPASDEERMRDDSIELQARLLAEARRVVADDSPAVLVLGATVLHGTARYLASELRCPVVDPGVVAIQTAERLRLLGLAHSKTAFPSPKRVQDEKLAPLLAGRPPG